AITAITAVGATELDVLFAPETQAAMAAITRLDPNSGFINEFHQSQPCTCRCSTGGGITSAFVAGYTAAFTAAAKRAFKCRNNSLRRSGRQQKTLHTAGLFAQPRCRGVFIRLR